MSQEEKEEKHGQSKSSRRWLKILFWSVLLLFLSLPLLIHLPFVQNWAMNRVTTYVKNKTGADLTFSEFSLDPRRHLLFKDLSLIQESDTILQSGSMEVRFGKPLHSLLQRKIHISEVQLENLYFHLVQYQDGSGTNIASLIDSLSDPASKPQKKKSKTGKRPFGLELDEVEILGVHFYHENLFKNNFENYHVERIYVQVDKIDPVCREMVVEEIRLTKPDVDIRQYIGTNDGPPKIEPEFPMIFLMKNVILEDGDFYLLNNRAKSQIKVPGRMDYSDFGISNIQGHLEDFSINFWKFGGRVQELSLTADTGYDMELTTEYSTVTCDQTSLNGCSLSGENMYLGNSIVLNYNGYKSFRNLTQRIFLDLDLEDSYLLVDDLMHFVPGLTFNDLFMHNKDRVLHFDGNLRGKFDALRGYGVQMQLADLMYYEGDFSTRNLTTDLPELFNLTIEKMVTSSDNLMAISPSLQIPSNFQNLGEIELAGYFDGFSKDFVISGVGTTSIGDYRLDMRLDTKGGARNANYSGELEVYDFSLREWTQNEDFGDVSFRAQVKNGFGLTLETVEAELTAKISSLEYNDYTYHDADASGVFRQNLFNGSLEIDDPNAHFSFAGVVDYLKKRPRLDFEAAVTRLDLQKLNFLDYPLAFSGDLEMDLIGDQLDNAVGFVRGRDLEIDQRRDTFELEELRVKLAFEGEDRIAVAESDLGDVKLFGEFLLSDIVNDFKYNMKYQYPEYFDILDLKLAEDYRSEANFSFSVEFEDSKYITGLLGAPNIRFFELEADGVFDNTSLSSNINLAWDSLTIKNWNLTEAQITQAGQQGDNVLGVYFGDVLVSKKSLSPIELDADITREVVLFGLQTERIADVFPTLDMLGEVTIQENSLALHLDRIFDRDENWVLNPDNKMALIGKSLIVTDMEINKDEKRFSLTKGEGSHEVDALLRGVDFSFLNSLVGLQSFDFGGLGSLEIHSDDLANFATLRGRLFTDSLFINDDLFGEWSSDAQWYNLDRSLGVQSTIVRDSSILTADGVIKLSSLSSDDPTQYDFNIEGKYLPLKILQYLIPKSITDTRGSFDAKLTISDENGKPVPGGSLLVHEGYTKVDYLKVGYFFEDQEVRIGRDMIDLSGAEIFDRLDNKAIVEGGIKHRFLSDLELDISLRSDRLLVLETKKGDNNLYYGTALGSVFAQFDGPLNSIDMRIDGATQAGSELTLPLGNQGGAGQLDNSFYVFVTEEENQEDNVENTVQELLGVNVSMNLRLTNQAQLKIVFDERTGDILSGNGEGNLNIELGRDGELEIFGDYRITSGQYLFTKSLINKRFQALPGGMIRWNGDPINANIDVNAKYDNLSTSLSVFLQDYLDLSSEETRRQAQNLTDVDLTLQLRGLLLTPEISFDLAFPDLTGELRSLADSRLRVLKADPDALNQQVGALIISRSFIPTNPIGGSYATNLAASSSFNTVSEFLSNQISVLISGLLSEAVTDVDFISNLDFQFGVSNYQVVEDIGGEDDNVLQNSEILINLQPSFLDDRLVFDAGANIVNNSPISNGTFVGEDLVIEYLLTEDGKIKLRAFQRSEETVNGRIRRFGLGLYYRTEFDNLNDLFSKANK